MFLLIYYIWVGYGVGDASPYPAPNPHGFLKQPPPPPIITADRVKPIPLGAGRSGYPWVGCKLSSLTNTLLEHVPHSLKTGSNQPIGPVQL